MWGKIWCMVTSSLVGLCINMRVSKSIQKISIFPNSKYICEKYGLSIKDPIRRSKRVKKINENSKTRSKSRPFSKKGDLLMVLDLPTFKGSPRPNQTSHCLGYDPHPEYVLVVVFLKIFLGSCQGPNIIGFIILNWPWLVL